MEPKEIIQTLKTIELTPETWRSSAGLGNLAAQFQFISEKCDSSSHEIAAQALEWAGERIRRLENCIREAQGSLDRSLVER